MRNIYKGLLGLLLILMGLIDAKAGDFSLLKYGVVNPEMSDVRSYDLTSIKKDKSIDGSTAASKLRANKSHYVSKQDETTLTVFLGILAIGFIVFFIKILGDKK